MDLTKITTPYGLLDAETQKALREHGGPYEWYNPYGKWSDAPDPNFGFMYTYRVRSEPQKPREWWINDYGGGIFATHPTKEVADRNAGHYRIACILVREVL